MRMGHEMWGTEKAGGMREAANGPCDTGTKQCDAGYWHSVWAMQCGIRAWCMGHAMRDTGMAYGPCYAGYGHGVWAMQCGIRASRMGHAMRDTETGGVQERKKGTHSRRHSHQEAVRAFKYLGPTPRKRTQETATAVQFAPVMPFLACDFGVCNVCSFPTAVTTCDVSQRLCLSCTVTIVVIDVG
eukprot:1969547-Rhodomonas_salina.1